MVYPKSISHLHLKFLSKQVTFLATDRIRSYLLNLGTVKVVYLTLMTLKMTISIRFTNLNINIRYQVNFFSISEFMWTWNFFRRDFFTFNLWAFTFLIEKILLQIQFWYYFSRVESLHMYNVHRHRQAKLEISWCHLKKGVMN